MFRAETQRRKEVLYRLQQTAPSVFKAIPVKEIWKEDAAEPSWQVEPSELYVDAISIAPRSDETAYRYGVLEVLLPSGSEVEPTTWGVNIEGLEGVQFEEGRYVPGDLIYTIPVDLLNQPKTFYHLVRFSQTGTFRVPMTRYCRMYAPAEKAYESDNDPEFRNVQVR